MERFHNINGEKVQFTPDEEIARDQEEEEWRNDTRKRVEKKEKEMLISDLKAALVWQFRMIETMWEIGVSKSIWSSSDIQNTKLKQHYVGWRTKISRLSELGE